VVRESIGQGDRAARYIEHNGWRTIRSNVETLAGPAMSAADGGWCGEIARRAFAISRGQTATGR